ncbi:peroxin [Drechmeria coniospora]|uniref:Peroxin n=1 Tax=Drechmeria coniospora TaxID=98403 RepID=A0A151GMN9_DRECN|nr:peroxin [Drechmeria coniospora]KYK58338.1 peroxin [Drechmeria coniospora]ODA83710.1 hypothetical protein RJ55_02225 [Drechmeria coniospora]
MDAKPGKPAEGRKKDVEVKEVEVNVTVASATVVTAQPCEPVPDPDEDDLDDLDGKTPGPGPNKVPTLDAEKASKATESAETKAAGSDAKPPTTGPEAKATVEDELSEEEFAKQLQAGMADLLGELEKSPEMQGQFEEMFKQMAAATNVTDAGDGADGSGTAKAPPAEAASEPSFQETIRRTMERMQNSGEQATAAATSGAEDDFMADMLKHLSSGDFGGEGGEEDFSKMLMGMMEQLTNKDILYEPMKELDDKFPGWFERNKETTSAEDMKRYEEQRVLVREIVVKFEDGAYSDGNSADREYIVERMQKMQAAGSPPADLVGDMASAQDAFNGDDQCNPQ